MIDALGRAAAWAALQAVSAPDTVLVRTVGTTSLFEKITNVASALLTVSVLVLALALLFAALRLRKSMQKLNGLLDRLYADVQPIVRHATAVADNIEYITTSVRTDVQQINATIQLANRRIHRAVKQTEGRLRDFNALLHVVQDEAEDAFVSAASTVRGVRRGAETLGRDGRPGLAEDEDSADELDAEALDEELEADEELTDLEEELDGYDRDSEPAARPVARPRVRPRGRWRDRA